ncbi:hypothetical protein OG244_19510 [Streptomyces brevispora]|uniref:hypothetical protein n=1 Tax=Streptomyces brevispora TaxID=887462 RepID=UPI002E361335|nr:hypothetical protein [Streptomyces brevispora]
MAHWIAFWTALWIGSEKITRRTVDWLCNARPTPPTPPPTAAADAEEADEQLETSTGEQQPKPAKKAAPQASADPEGSALLRWVGVLIAAIVAKTLPYTTVITCSLATVWVLTALGLGYAAALPDKTDKGGEDGKETPPEEPPADEPHPREILTREHVALLLAEVYTEGSGVHLATLAEHLSRTPLMGLPATPWATRDVRTLMGRHEVRIRPGVRVPPAGGREGVHREDFPPLPSPPSDPPVVGVVVPGQSNNNNPSNSPGYVITDDPTNPVRHTVHHTERA